jgi:hypothetical protein
MGKRADTSLGVMGPIRQRQCVQDRISAGSSNPGVRQTQANCGDDFAQYRRKYLARLGGSVDISVDQRDAGREMAALSLRLTQELKLEPQKLGSRHWLMGAHYIAERRLELALAAAAQAFAEAGDRPAEMMTRGYCALARKLSPNRRQAAQMELDEVLRRLGQEASKSAVFYRDQIMMADRLLCPGS